MKRRSFITASAVAGTAAVIPGVASAATTPQPANKDIYELRVYQTKGGGQKNQIKKFLTTAVAPFINKLGGKVGIFTEYGMQEPPKLYVLLTFPGAESYYRFMTELDNNAEYKSKGAEYLTSDPAKPLFNRYETWLLDAFDGIPQFRQPDASRGLLELRIYESYNEDAGRRKVEMFNKGEIALFDKVGLNSVFFGKIIAGPQMPALIYMLAFKDMAQREENWAKFRVHPDWKEMSGKPEYANTVSQVNKIFLVPEEGSQI